MWLQMLRHYLTTAGIKQFFAISDTTFPANAVTPLLLILGPPEVVKGNLLSSAQIPPRRRHAGDQILS